MKESVEEKKGHIRMLLNQQKIFKLRIEDAAKVVASIEKEISGFRPELVEKVKKEMEDKNVKES